MDIPYRYGTGEAIAALAALLSLPNDDPFMQDWSYIMAEAADIEKYMALYEKLEDEDQKFVLMEMMIQAVEDQPTEDLFLKYSTSLELILERDFFIHEYTVYYWSCFDNELLEDCWRITPMMRDLWEHHR